MCIYETKIEPICLWLLNYDWPFMELINSKIFLISNWFKIKYHDAHITWDNWFLNGRENGVDFNEKKKKKKKKRINY